MLFLYTHTPCLLTLPAKNSFLKSYFHLFFDPLNVLKEVHYDFLETKQEREKTGTGCPM